MQEAERRIAEIAEDRSSGAAELAIRALQVLISRAEAGDGPEQLLRLCDMVARAKPCMAPLLYVAHVAATGLERDPTGLAELLQEELEALALAPQRIAMTLEGFVPSRGTTTVLTYSYSSTVLEVLLRLGQRRRLRVVCSESRPGMEGRRLAERLAGGGLEVTFCVDALLADFLEEADLVVVGADALLWEGVVNKAGTAGLAALAHRAGVPAWCLADRSKLLPPALASRLFLPEEDPEEVWPGAPRGVRVVNRYFELVPWGPLRGVLTPEGPWEADRVRAELQALSTSPFLRRHAGAASAASRPAPEPAPPAR